MKKVIWKFPLQQATSQVIKMPVGAEILTMQEQNGKPCLWALVDPAAKIERRIFEVFGTGHPIHYGTSIDRKYIGTFQLSGGALIYHVFEHLL